MKHLYYLLVIALFSYSSVDAQAPKDTFFYIIYSNMDLAGNLDNEMSILEVRSGRYAFVMQHTGINNEIVHDTIAAGDFRKSSIDSILKLIKDTPAWVETTNLRITGGTLETMKIATYGKVVDFVLHSKPDPTADKIIAILKTYMRPSAASKRTSQTSSRLE